MSTCCQSTNKRLAVVIGYQEIRPHDEAYEALSTKYLAGWRPSNRLRPGTCRCVPTLSSDFLQQWVADSRVCCSLARNIWRSVPHHPLNMSSKSRLRAFSRCFFGCDIRPDGVVRMMRTKNSSFERLSALWSAKIGKLSGGTHLEPAIKAIGLVSAETNAISSGTRSIW